VSAPLGPSHARPRLKPPPPTAVAVELTVPFHDVDVLEVAWHGHYPKYLDLARTELLRSRGLDVGDLRALGYRFLLSESYLRHASPLRYGDRFRVLAWLVEVESRIRIAYQIVNLTREVLSAEGYTVLVTSEASGGLCLETPAAILERLRGAPGSGPKGSRTPPP